MARVFCKKATRNRFDGLAPAYGQAAWARFLASRAFEIMILRIETSINNVFLLPQAYTGVEGYCSQEPSKARLCPNRCQRVPDLGPRYFVPNNEERMGAAWSNRVVQLPFRSRGGGALFDPGRFASGRFHGKNGSRSAGAWPPATAKACMYSVSHDRGLIPHRSSEASSENSIAASWPLYSDRTVEIFPTQGGVA